MTEELLRDQFSKFGKVSNVTIMKDSEGKSRGFGFVNFDSSEEAKNAAGALNGAFIGKHPTSSFLFPLVLSIIMQRKFHWLVKSICASGSKYLFVGRAQRKAEREELLKRAHMERYNCHNEQLKASNLYVKNLNASVNENKLKEHFSTCGQLMSVKVMRDGNGISKGFGFVCFSNHEDAMKALSTLNGKICLFLYSSIRGNWLIAVLLEVNFFAGTILEGRPLYVAMAQRKEDRFKALQNSHPQFSAKNFYPLNWNVLPEFHPLLHHFPPSPPLNHLQPEPIMYHNFHTNVGGQYPLATQTFHDHFSVSVRNFLNSVTRIFGTTSPSVSQLILTWMMKLQVPTRQREWGDTKDQVYQQHVCSVFLFSRRKMNLLWVVSKWHLIAYSIHKITIFSNKCMESCKGLHICDDMTL